jgi:hypothetical protein
MTIEGGCYCGAVRFKVDGDIAFKGQCHCRECQYISGGQPNVVLGMPEAGFEYTKGAPKAFRRSDLDNPVTREFCAECGTPLLSRAPGMPGTVLLKVGARSTRRKWPSTLWTSKASTILPTVSRPSRGCRARPGEGPRRDGRQTTA